MSDTTPTGYPPAYGPVKTLAVRVSEDVRGQLDIIAQLNDHTVTEEIRLALEAWIEKSKSDPAVLQRAESVRAEIEREAQTKAQRDLVDLRRQAFHGHAACEEGRGVVSRRDPVAH